MSSTISDRYCVTVNQVMMSTVNINMTSSFIDYINNAVIKLPVYLICTCVLFDKVNTQFLCDLMNLYRTVVHTNIKMFVLVLFISIYFSVKNNKDNHISTLTFLNCRNPST